MNKKQTKKPVGFKKNIRHHIKLALIPHKANHYQPHLIRRYGLAAVVVIVTIAQIAYLLPPTGGTVLGSEASISASDLLTDTNNERTRSDLPTLSLDDKLSKAAFLKASDMFEKQYWAHTAPDGTTPWRWFGTVGYNYNYAGENLAKNFRTADAVTTAWMSSSEHRANVLGVQYSQVGFATVDGTLDGKAATIVVALYGSPATSAVVAGARTAVHEQAPDPQSLGLMTRFGAALQSLSPMVLGSVMLMLAVAGVALLAHFYRNKLPKSLRTTLYKHHGLAKAGGMLGLCLIVVFLYSGGQI